MHELALTKAWLLLLAAGVLEAIWAVGLKFTEGFSRPLPSLLVGVSIVASVLLLSLAVRDLPIGTAYAVWTGIGVMGAAALGIMLLDERLTFARAFFLLLLLVAIIGLHLSENPSRA
jgi:quaternary ammonium compound-resistance protein SugE